MVYKTQRLWELMACMWWCAPIGCWNVKTYWFLHTKQKQGQRTLNWDYSQFLPPVASQCGTKSLNLWHFTTFLWWPIPFISHYFLRDQCNTSIDCYCYYVFYYLNLPNQVLHHTVQLFPIRLICHTPIVIRGLDVISIPFVASWRCKNSKKTAFAWPIATVSCNTRPVVATSGFRCSPVPPLLGDVHGIEPVHCYGHQKWPANKAYFPIFVLPVTLAATGAIQSK